MELPSPLLSSTCPWGCLGIVSLQSILAARPTYSPHRCLAPTITLRPPWAPTARHWQGKLKARSTWGRGARLQLCPAPAAPCDTARAAGTDGPGICAPLRAALRLNQSFSPVLTPPPPWPTRHHHGWLWSRELEWSPGLNTAHYLGSGSPPLQGHCCCTQGAAVPGHRNPGCLQLGGDRGQPGP